jgi:ribA/ribD-fused uncharacterized protein
VSDEKPDDSRQRLVSEFYSVGEAYGAFSNCASHPFELDSLRWRTVERFFQAQKFAGTAHDEAIRQTSSPMVAARMGRSRARPLRSDWELVKDEIMLRAVRAKCAQHAQLATMLL